ncbi:Pleckstrin homology domain-containing protein, partial [Leptodontidium sp. 2 PMI_412]
MSDVPVSSTSSSHIAVPLIGPFEASGRGLIGTSNTASRENAGSQPIFQACIELRQRLSEIPECNAQLTDAANGEDDDSDGDIDPVSILWRCLRETTILITIYNSTYPEHPLEFDEPTDPARKPKMAAFKFIEACLKVLKMSPKECFRMRDLFGDDTTGFVKVTRLIERVLDGAKTKVIPTSLGIDAAGSKVGTPESQPQYRDYVVRELVETERKYIQKLEQLHNLKELIGQRGVITGNAVHDIFLNLDAILDVGRRILIKVEMINLQPSNEQKWGLPFAAFEENFIVYVPYIANQRNATATALQEFHKIAQIDHALTVDSNALEMFLMGPLPRLLKYPLILKDLRDKTGADEKTKADLTSGIEAMERVIQKASDAIDRDLRNGTLASLCARVEDWKNHQVDDFGDLLMFGQFPIIKEKAWKEYEIYSFERILLVCTEVNPFKLRTKLSFFQKDKPRDKDLINKDSKLRLKGRIFMSNVTDVIALDRAGQPGNYTVQVFFKGDPGIENFIIRFPDESVMKRWYYTMDEQLKNRA